MTRRNRLQEGGGGNFRHTLRGLASGQRVCLRVRCSLVMNTTTTTKTLYIYNREIGADAEYQFLSCSVYIYILLYIADVLYTYHYTK